MTIGGKSLGQTIRAARIRAELSQREFAAKTMLARSSVSYLETGKFVPSGDTLRLVAEVLNLDETELRALGGKLEGGEWAYLQHNPTALRLLRAMDVAKYRRAETERLIKQVEKGVKRA